MLFGLAFSGIASLFLIAGTALVVAQNRSLARLVEVSATVAAQEPGGPESPLPASDWQEPPLLRYTLGGQAHEAPMPFDDSIAWESSRAAPQPGTTLRVWVDPDEPSLPRLSRQPDIFPYFFLLFPMIHFTIGLAVALLGGSGGTLMPASRSARIGLVALVWNGVGGAALASYLSAGGGSDIPLMAAFGAYGLAGLILLLVWLRYRGRSSVGAGEPRPLSDQ